MKKHISFRPPGIFKKYDNSDQIFHQSHIKLYLMEIQFVDTGEIFNKFGITHHYNAEKRIDPRKNIAYNFFKLPVRVLASAWLPVEEAKKQECYLQDKYLKNIYIDISFDGISECLILNKKDRSDSIGYIMDLHKRHKVARQPVSVAS